MPCCRKRDHPIFRTSFDGFLPCDGSLVSVATYPDLFALLGYSYGGSDAQFGLPKLTAPRDFGLYYICATGLLGGTFASVAGVLGDIRYRPGPVNNDPSSPPADGSALPITENQTLFSLLGNRFGGDDVNFNLPNFPSLRPANGPAIASYIVAQGIFPNQSGDPLAEAFIGQVRYQAVTYLQPGWLECDGAPANELDYIDLVNVIGGLFIRDGGFRIPLLFAIGGCAARIAYQGIFPGY